MQRGNFAGHRRSLPILIAQSKLLQGIKNAFITLKDRLRMAHSKCLAETSDGSAQSSKRKRRAAVYRSGKGDHTRSDARANLMKAICSSCSTPSPSQVRQS